MTDTAPTLKEIRIAHAWKRDYERYLILSRYLFRPVGFLATWLAIRAGLTTEGISWISGIIGLTACIILASVRETFQPAALVLLMLFNLLDCVDGSLARTLKTGNPYGRFLDSVCGGVIDLGFWAVVGILAFRHPMLLHYPNGFGYGAVFWLGMGGATCFLAATLGYMEQSYDELLHPAWRQLNQSTSPNSGKRNSSKGEEPPAHGLLRVIARNLRVRETHYVLLSIAWWIRAVDLLLIVYLAYYGVHVVLALLLYTRRGRAVRTLWPTDKTQ